MTASGIDQAMSYIRAGVYHKKKQYMELKIIYNVNIDTYITTSLGDHVTYCI